MSDTHGLCTRFGVWLHGPSGQCKRVSTHDTEKQARDECARLNEQEQAEGRGATGCYYVVDIA